MRLAVGTRNQPTRERERFVTLELIRDFYAYDRWASERIFDAARGLTTEQLNTPGTAGHGSVRETILHQISAQKNWFSWWDGSMSQQEAMTSRLDPDNYPDLDAVHRVWEDVQAQSRTFIEPLTEEDLQREYTVTFPWTGQTVTFTLAQMMLHVANHGTQHRSEVAAMLTSFDCSPGYLDLLFFMAETAAALSS